MLGLKISLGTAVFLSSGAREEQGESTPYSIGPIWLKSTSINSVERISKLHPFLQNSQLHNRSLDGVHLDEKGNLVADLDVMNWMVFPNNSVTKAIWGMLQAKCLLTLNRDELGPQNHYRLGELSIGGIISATKSRFRLLSFHTSPSGQLSGGKILVTTILHDVSLYLKEMGFTQSIHSIFSFLMKTNQRATNHGLSLPFYSAMRRFAEESFMCLYTKDTFSVKLWRQCREREELEALPKEKMDQILSLDNYFIYNTIWALHSFFQSSQFYNNSIEGVYLDDNEKLVADLDIVIWVHSINKSVSQVQFGSLQRGQSLDFKLRIYPNAIAKMEELNQFRSDELNLTFSTWIDY
ncbi:hypothetical protein E2320_014273 [Naja naja]|nr:hypothetical protein E2320_014273 [Naja naja]